MPYCQLHWFSNVLSKAVGTNVILPVAGEGPFPVFYLLHGLSDDYTIWQRRTRLEIYAEKYPLIIVMPDGFRGFYTNNTAGPAYANYIGEELPGMIERHFNVEPARSARAIGGLSMGGYGALRIALGFPDRFVSANSHSGAVMNGSRAKVSPRLAREEGEQIFGRHPRGTDHDLLRLAGQCKKGGKLPRIRIDCGTEDFLLADNREFHEKLERLGVGHEYQEFPGEHEWDYWDIHIQEALAFHARAMKLKVG